MVEDSNASTSNDHKVANGVQGQQEVTTAPQASEMIKSAFDAAEALKAERVKIEATLKQIQEVKSFELLGGKSQGATPQQPQRPETDREYRLRLEQEVREGKHNDKRFFR